MLNPPEAVSEEDLRALSANTWKPQVTALEYVSVGFAAGSGACRDNFVDSLAGPETTAARI